MAATTNSSPERGEREVAMSATFNMICTCGCEQVVEASDAGFAATTVEVEACDSLRKEWGMASQTIRKSAAYAAAVPAASGLRRRDGLVVLG